MLCRGKVIMPPVPVEPVEARAAWLFDERGAIGIKGRLNMVSPRSFWDWSHSIGRVENTPVPIMLKYAANLRSLWKTRRVSAK